MSRKVVPGIMFTLFILSLLALGYGIQPVKASGTIFIRADGSVDPDTAPISTVNNVTYTFTDNIYDEIVVERDNIVVDGAGYTLQGTKSGTGIDLSGRSNITIKNTKIKWFEDSILLSESSNNTVSGNNMTSNVYGILLFDGSTNNILTANTIEHNLGGVHLYQSSDNTVSGNTITNNLDEGIWLFGSSNNTVSGNNITENGSPGYGILLGSSSNNIIKGSNITENVIGISLHGSSCNVISGNNITYNGEGVDLYHSSDNKFYHNNFIDNYQQQVRTYMPSYANLWDNGYSSGGNYWSNLNRADSYRGPYQNVTGSDGISDTPYIIDDNNRDNYPLMKPYGGPYDPYDIGITSITTTKTVVSQGYNLNLNIAVKTMNYGIDTETFNLTAYANTTVIKTKSVTLPSGNPTTVTFTWNTTGFAKGSYIIKAIADTIPGETDTADNTYIGGIIRITIPGDVDGDFDVDLFDAVRVSRRYGARKGDPNYEPNCDINNNGQIFLYDAVIIGAHYGQKDP